MSELAAMKTLVMLRDSNSLTEAARLMDEPKSTLSRRLAMLEAQLGHPLTCQSGRRLALTPAGRCYASYAEQILQLADAGRQAVQALRDEPAGELRVGLCSELSRGWSTDTLNLFSQKYPGVRMDIRIFESTELFDDSDIDLWISCCSRFAGRGLRSRLLGRWEQGLYAAETLEEERIVSDLEKQRWICGLEAREEVVLRRGDTGERVKISMSERLTINSLHMRADAIALGYGIGLLPCWTAECRRHGLKGLKRILPHLKGEDILLRVHYQPGRKTAAVAALQKWLSEHLPQRWIPDRRCAC